MAEIFTDPELIDGVQATRQQCAAHCLGSALIGIGQHGQSFGPFLQRLGQRLRGTAMQAHPGGVLPWAPEACKGELKRGGRGVEPQPFHAKLTLQDPSDAEPERITAGQNDS